MTPGLTPKVSLDKQRVIRPGDEGLALPRYRLERKYPSRPKTLEAAIQAQAEAYAALKSIEAFHLPEYVMANAFRRRAMSGAELGAARAASAKIKGFPDLILMNPTTRKFDCVEIKTVTGTLSHAQRQWLRRLVVTICRSFEEVKTIIDKLAEATK